MRARVCEKTVHIKTCVSVRMHIIYIYIYIMRMSVAVRVFASACVLVLHFCFERFRLCLVAFSRGMGLNRGRDTDALVTASLVDVVGADERLAGATASLASVAKTPCGPINLMS